MSFGIACSIKAELGTSPVSSLPFVLSQFTPLSVGIASVLVNSTLILLQILLLRRQYDPIQLIQLPVALIFGTLTDTSLTAGVEAVPVAGRDEVHTGKAVIRSNIAGDEVKEYQVEITHIYPEGSGKDMTVKVTDEALLSATGGIVQGMSGSPILQDGKLIGAVTHVLVNDPTQGYGILLEHMLDAADSPA